MILRKESGKEIKKIFIERPVFKDALGIEHRFIIDTSFDVEETGKFEFEVSSPKHSTKKISGELNNDGDVLSFGVIELDKIIELGEVQVVASKVKMVMKGDTIVYNADAFSLAKGSMLDKLIAMLPGAAINEKGQITVNGEFVSSLLINGKDFFRGNPSVALQNIPYYTVNQVKVYRREGEDAYLQERTEAERKNDPLVMDVMMKEKFLGTSLGHLDFAGGTESRYSLRAFLAAFGKRHNFAVYGNLNNVGANTNPSKDAGIWQNGMAGILDDVYRSAGLSYNFSNEGEKKAFMVDASGSSDSRNPDYNSASIWYYPENYSTSSRSTAANHNTRGHFTTRLYGALGFPEFYTSATFDIGFRRDTDRHQYSYSQHKGDEFMDTISVSDPDFINRVFSKSRIHTTDFNIGGSPSINFKIPGLRDNMYVTLNAYHYRTKSEELSVGHNVSNEGISILNKFISNPGYSTNFSLNAGITHRFKSEASVKLRYSLEHTEKHNERALSHFLPDSMIMDLPVVTDRLTMISDLRQSFTAIKRNLTNKIELSSGFSTGSVHYSVELPVNWIKERLRDTRAPYIRRNTFTFNPSLNIFWKSLKFSYSIYNFTPTAEQLLDFSDDSDLMVIRKGNPDLRNPQRHNASILLSGMIPQKNMNYSLSAAFTENIRSIANAVSFNPSNGVSTITAFNVDGNRKGLAEASFGKGFGYLKRFNLTVSVGGNMERSVAFASTGAQGYARSVVHTANISPSFSLAYVRGIYGITGEIGVNRFLCRGNLDSFIRTKAWSGTPTISGWLKLPGDFQIESSISDSFRTGYVDQEMNGNYVYWNASLLKSFGTDGKWSFRVDAVDILGQVSSITRNVNAQGITETRYNVIGRYFLLHIQYLFKFPVSK